MIKKITFLLVFLLIPSGALSAPHIGGRPEPFKESVGAHLTQRLNAPSAAGGRGLAAPPASYPANIRVLFLRVDFQPDADPKTTGDGTWTDPAYAYSGDPAYTGNPSDYWVSKTRTRFKGYYQEVSYGLLNVTVDVSASVYRMPGFVYNYSASGYSGIEALIRDAVTASAADVDFSLYDAVLIVHAGAGAETDINNDTPHDLWSLYYSASCIDGDPNATGCQPLTANGRQIKEAIIVPQNASQDGLFIDNLGIYVHEMGHWLGLPDLYNTSLVPLTDGVGKWSLMGDGIYLGNPMGSSPAHLDAWSKVYLGWVTPTTVLTYPDPGAKVLQPVETAKSVLKLQAASNAAGQHFLLENRQLVNYDSALPGHGLLVWLIDEDTIAANIASNTVNSVLVAPGVTLVEADGNNALMTVGDNDLGSAGDPFPGSTGNTQLTPQSAPASTPHTGNAWVNIKDVRETASDISFTVGFSPDVPLNPSATLSCGVTTVRWSAVTAADLAYYKVYKNGVFVSQVTGTVYETGSADTNSSFKISAVDSNGNESPLSQAAVISGSGCSGAGNTTGGNTEDGGKCFVATAAFGSYEAPYVKILREFRDRYMITNFIGRRLVSLYYSISPPAAHLIEKSESLKTIARLLLLPFIGVAAFFVKTSLLMKLAALTALGACVAFFLKGRGLFHPLIFLKNLRP